MNGIVKADQLGAKGWKGENGKRITIGRGSMAKVSLGKGSMANVVRGKGSGAKVFLGKGSLAKALSRKGSMAKALWLERVYGKGITRKGISAEKGSMVKELLVWG